MAEDTSTACAGRVCVVTGAGRGLGREYALLLAAQGAAVVVNDLGSSRDGGVGQGTPADDVVAEIVAAGGTAVADDSDISTWAGAEGLIARTIETFGRLDVLVNNAGVLRDRMMFSTTEDEWDDVIRVHLKGTFACSRHAAAFWRSEAKNGRLQDARLINTSSMSGLYASPGQTNYAVAKAGIATMTQVAAIELAPYGVTANAIAPGALTRLTQDLDLPASTLERFQPGWVAPVVLWLASSRSADITGQVIESSGLILAIAEGWRRGPSTSVVPETIVEVDVAVRALLERAQPRTTMAEAAALG